MEPLRIVLDWSELYAYRCPTCDGERNLVPGQGPRPCRWFALDESPSENENKRKQPICGMAGYEFDNTYLKIAGLSRSEIFVSNVVHCQSANNRKPKPADAHWCSGHFLPSELAMVQPELLIAMGATACGIFTPEINLEACHGIPQWRELYDWEGWVLPTYRPSSGLSKTELMVSLLEDFEALRKIVDGADPQSLVPVDRWPRPMYAEVNGEVLARLLEDNCAPNELSIDQENENGEMRSVQVSRMPGTGFLFRTADEKAMSVFREHCARDKRFVYLLHNAGQDLDWLARYGIVLPEGMDRLRDTMQEAFHLGNLPQGLKPLSYRLCGMAMTGYADTVDPPSRMAVTNWMKESKEFVLPKILDSFTKKGKPKYTIIKNPLATSIKRILEHMEETPEVGQKKYDPWKAWQHEKIKWAEKLDTGDADEEKAELAVRTIIEIEDKLGPIPTRGLGQVDKEKELEYACRDADATLRVAHVMSERRKHVGEEVSVKDYSR